MTASKADVQAKIDHSLTTIAGAAVMKTYVEKNGSDPSKWPVSTSMGSAAQELLAARAEAGDLVDPTADPAPPPPPPVSTGYDALVAALSPPQFEYVGQPIVCTTRAQFDTAYGKLQPGQWIDCRGITFQGEIKAHRALSALAKITYDAACKFVGNSTIGSAPTSALDVTGAAFTQHLFAKGASITNPGGNGIHAVGGTHHCTFDGVYVHDTGADGVDWFGGPYGDTHDNFLRAEIENVALQSLKFDPHAEKGTGLHGMNLQDSNHSSVRNNIVAIYVHDCPKYGGSAIECGVASGGSQPYGNHYYIKAERLLMNAKSQTAGNGMNWWGGAQHDNIVHVIEVDHIAGHGINQDSSSAAYTNVVVQAGTATNYCLNPRYAGQSPWMKRKGMVYAPGLTPAA